MVLCNINKMLIHMPVVFYVLAASANQIILVV